MLLVRNQYLGLTKSLIGHEAMVIEATRRIRTPCPLVFFSCKAKDKTPPGDHRHGHQWHEHQWRGQQLRGMARELLGYKLMHVPRLSRSLAHPALVTSV